MSAKLEKPISISFSLIGLYLVCERGYNGRQVQLAHMTLAKKSKEWPRFNPPPMTGTMTVSDVVNGIDGENYRNRIRDWAALVWKAWCDQHSLITDLVKRYLD
jgi:hypothetical protein